MHTEQQHTLTPPVKTVWWAGDNVCLIDQTALPNETVIVTCTNVADVAHAIRSMQVRGAPAIGATAAYGVALAAQQTLGDSSAVLQAVEASCKLLEQTRPTAVNLFWALNRMQHRAHELDHLPSDELRQALLAEAQQIAAEDEAACRAIGRYGADLIAPGTSILTHCNAGALACVSYGTALGVIRAAWERYGNIHVYVDETRPFLQGARLTAWELVQEHIPLTLITDNMAGHFLQRKKIGAVVVGADRIAANGDVANKIGTYSVAVLAHENSVPFYVAAPLSTIDFSLSSGTEIPIEERDPGEVSAWRGIPTAPAHTPAAHPAFDVTPARYVTAIITERGIAYSPYAEQLRRLKEHA
ncbi:MAG: S-methyl-5-thioribose-1-phosphate isomerase [Chloroflexi bacterium]|nr:S-methyl-5-thioribose-1-phosphate isomerase [Chloroflexota bacterium]